MAKQDYEVLDDRFAPLINVTAHVEKLYEGCRWAEGPAYFPAGRYLVWSDIPNDRMLRFDEATGTVGVFRHPAGYSNGNTVDRRGRLVTCEHGFRRVTRTEHDGRVTVIADGYAGKRFNSPGASNLYRVDPRSGEVRIAAGDFVRPNGLAFSPDESRLYVSDTGASHVPDGPRHIRVFAVGQDGALSGGEVFATSTAQFRRLPLRRCRPAVDQRRRRRALLRPGRHADRQGAGAGDHRQRRVRRPEAQPPVHLRDGLALRGDARRQRHQDVLSQPLPRCSDR
jgi:hypothetical protein